MVLVNKVLYNYNKKSYDEYLEDIGNLLIFENFLIQSKQLVEPAIKKSMNGMILDGKVQYD